MKYFLKQKCNYLFDRNVIISSALTVGHHIGQGEKHSAVHAQSTQVGQLSVCNRTAKVEGWAGSSWCADHLNGKKFL